MLSNSHEWKRRQRLFPSALDLGVIPKCGFHSEATELKVCSAFSSLVRDRT